MIEDDAGLRRILLQNRVIAVVGLSANPRRPSHTTARYMLEHGYTIIPVNPVCAEVFGQKCYASLRDIPQPVDIVDCFRRAEEIPALADEAIAIGAKVLWMQLGIIHPEAARKAEATGLEVVMDRCVKIEHARLCGGASG
ncbi:MAG: CoA-binding protein [Zoogloeaceae bacterium]|jgi:predicted CoA-binding protein|nr:CoA-binding protein [Zoogloeaceae bacterium]